MTDYSVYYKDRENCNRELIKARELMGSRATTFEGFDRLACALAMMLFYCPEDMADIVRGQIEECGSRQRLAFMHGMISPKKQ